MTYAFEFDENIADKPQFLSIDEDGILIMPEGYKYCNECGSLTPHEIERHSAICKVCESNVFGYTCENCGYEFNEEIGPVTVGIEDAEKLYTIYPAPFALNYLERDVFSMDCSNPIEWEYDLICPICRMINHFEDGNC
jgi:hypothetical protein